MHTYAHLCTPAHTRSHPLTTAHTRAHPHIPTDALNLINHMKLHVNGKIEKGGKKKIDRKRKEQESAEVFQWTNKKKNMSPL